VPLTVAAHWVWAETFSVDGVQETETELTTEGAAVMASVAVVVELFTEVAVMVTEVAAERVDGGV
jgi:hypothetical protein